MRDRATWRDAVEETLFAYTAIADRKDVDAVVEQLGDAQVRFPHARAEGPDEVAALYRALWAGAHPHRHVVTNVRLQVDPDARRCTATALYTRWSLEPEPVVTTLGTYEMHLADSGGDVRVVQLVVGRLWHREH